jgi:hypothetical protein
MIRNVVLLIVKCFVVCTFLLFFAMTLGMYVSALLKGVDLIFYDVVESAAKDSIKGGGVMSVVALILMLKNYLFRSDK